VDLELELLRAWHLFSLALARRYFSLFLLLRSPPLLSSLELLLLSVVRLVALFGSRSATLSLVRVLPVLVLATSFPLSTTAPSDKNSPRERKKKETKSE
jgi:hypothetical protein